MLGCSPDPNGHVTGVYYLQGGELTVTGNETIGYAGASGATDGGYFTQTGGVHTIAAGGNMVFAGKGLYTLSGGTLNVAGIVSDQSGSGLIDVTGGTLNMTGGTDGIAVQVDSGSIEWTQGGFGSVVNVGPQG